jgi:zinc protease
LAALIEAINIKVTEKLREEMSGIYHGGLSGSIQKRPYVHYTVSANIPCGPENVAKLTDSLIGIIKTIQEKGAEQKIWTSEGDMEEAIPCGITKQRFLAE